MKSGEGHDSLTAFGSNLKKIRNSKGLSLRALAAACTSLDHSDIAKIERGETNATLLTILQLAKGLEVSPEELFKF
jgi:transcriptional regulator with XRE-family HTH domain